MSRIAAASQTPTLALFDPEAFARFMSDDHARPDRRRRGPHFPAKLDPRRPAPADESLWVERYTLELGGVIYPIQVFVGREAPTSGDAIYNPRAGAWVGSRMGAPRSAGA